MKKYGRTRKAVTEAIRICKDRNVLSEYLSSKESEVVDIMMVLYDEEQIMRSYVESEVYDSKIETAKEMIESQEPIEKIVKYSRLPKEAILELQRKESL